MTDEEYHRWQNYYLDIDRKVLRLTRENGELSQQLADLRRNIVEPTPPPVDTNVLVSIKDELRTILRNDSKNEDSLSSYARLNELRISRSSLLQQIDSKINSQSAQPSHK